MEPGAAPAAAASATGGAGLPVASRAVGGDTQRRAATMARQAVLSLVPRTGRKRAPKLQTCIRYVPLTARAA